MRSASYSRNRRPAPSHWEGRGAEASIGFSAVGSGYHISLGNNGDARLAPSQVGVFRRECAMRMLKPFTSNTRLVTLCSRCHHSEFIHSDPTGGSCLFSECECPRFVPKRRPRDSQEADGELSS
jgi:hypothetical protein